MAGILENVSDFFLNIYNWFLGFFDFDLFGKNIRLELNGIIIAAVCFLIGILIFRSVFGKSESSRGKFLIIFVFVCLYLIVQIWIF